MAPYCVEKIAKLVGFGPRVGGVTPRINPPLIRNKENVGLAFCRGGIHLQIE